MTPEDCQGCPYFDGEDICEASRVKLAFGSMVFPIPISQIKVCEHFHDEDESDVLPTSTSLIVMRNTSKDKEGVSE